MEELKKIDRGTILRAISGIKENPEIRNGRESTTYDLVFEEECFPPILVLSEANKLAGGAELTLSDFNNNTQKAFSILEEHGFKVLNKNMVSDLETVLKEKLASFSFEDAKMYFEYLNIIVNELSIQKNDPRVVFSVRRDHKRLAFTIGQRYCLVLQNTSDKSWGYITPDNTATPSTVEVSKFEGSLVAYWNKTNSSKDVSYALNKIKTACHSELERSSKSSYLKFNNSSFEKAVFDTNYRNKIFMETFNGPNYKFDPNVNNAWIEKTLVKGRADRESGNYRLGKKLWSPKAAKNGADIYSNMRHVKPGDLIIHLTDNEAITGLSIASDEYKEGQGLEGTDWEGEAYLIDLKGFKKISPINRDKILNEKYKSLLLNLSEKHDVFYTKYLNLRQGAYLTECPTDLIRIINQEYKQISKEGLPYTTSDVITKRVEMNINTLYSDLNKCRLIYSKQLVIRFVSSISTKSFLILTGLSGSGKTKLAQAFAEWICEDERQVNLVPVGADWTNREPLLGYPNALESESYVLPESGVLQLILRAKKDPERPYFLILDEMNLSHVERYFADFLSAIESEKEIKLHSGNKDWKVDEYRVPSALTIPRNLFIIGTVNIDETTYMFSPKVLDRANVIEFRVNKNEIESFLENPSDVNLSELEGQGSGIAQDFVRIATNPAKEFSDKNILSDELLKLFDSLTEVGAEFGYRTANEIARFAGLAEQLAEDWGFNEIMDAAISQKLLPKLHGSRRKLEKVLFRLGDLCHPELENNCEDLFKNHKDITYEVRDKARYPVSFEKIVRMHKGLLDNGFTSFAEA